jgi:hypothetical protein
MPLDALAAVVTVATTGRFLAAAQSSVLPSLFLSYRFVTATGRSSLPKFVFFLVSVVFSFFFVFSMHPCIRPHTICAVGTWASYSPALL